MTYKHATSATRLTGAKQLDLPLVSQGATPVDLIRRPALDSNENVANAPVFGQRYFAQASLRILLSDRAATSPVCRRSRPRAPVALDGTYVPASEHAAGCLGDCKRAAPRQPIRSLAADGPSALEHHARRRDPELVAHGEQRRQPDVQHWCASVTNCTAHDGDADTRLHGGGPRRLP